MSNKSDITLLFLSVLHYEISKCFAGQNTCNVNKTCSALINDVQRTQCCKTSKSFLKATVDECLIVMFFFGFSIP